MDVFDLNALLANYNMNLSNQTAASTTIAAGSTSTIAASTAATSPAISTNKPSQERAATGHKPSAVTPRRLGLATVHRKKHR